MDALDLFEPSDFAAVFRVTGQDGVPFDLCRGDTGMALIGEDPAEVGITIFEKLHFPVGGFYVNFDIAAW